MVSTKPLFETQKRILETIFSIINNYYKNKNKNPNNIYCYKNYEQYNLISFYFSFLLNSLNIANSNSHSVPLSFYISDLPIKNKETNDNNNDYFIKYFIDNGSPFPLHDYNMSILLDKFHIEDLITIYQAILLEYKIILVYENCDEINTIIFSLLDLIYPFKWNYPINSFMLHETSVLLDAPFAIIMGVNSKYKNLISFRLKKNQFNKETLVYDLKEKNFIFIGQSFQEFPVKILNELRSNLYFLKSEKLDIENDDASNKGYINQNCDIMKIYGNNVYDIEHFIYFNMKLISVFFGVIIRIIKNFDKFYIKEKIKNIDIQNCQISDLFDFEKFKDDFKKEIGPENEQTFIFFSNFIKTLMFSNFLRSFYLKKDKKEKYDFISKITKNLQSKNSKNGKKQLKEIFGHKIKNKTVQYYKVSYYTI